MQVPAVSVEGVPDPIPDDLHILDVREQLEWDYGHIEGSQHIPLSQLGQRTEEVPHDRRILVVCAVGGRSAQVVAWLARNGVDAVNLDGGLMEWAGAGRPLVSETGNPPQVV
jgi:rhodanese-related sulfurtransferase